MMMLRTLLAIAAWLALPFASPALAEDTRTPLQVTYTGRTLGYLRFPDQQPLNFTSCDASAKMSGAAQIALPLLNPESGPKPELLLGMGDNFAPDLYSRVFSDPASPTAFKAAKDLYTWDFLTTHNWIPDDTVAPNSPLSSALEAGAGILPADNVGCFLKRAAFDAIVPGKHDFYYGPERLRMLARFLKTSTDGHVFRPVEMLAANLAVTTTRPEAYPRVPAYQIQETLNHRFKKTGEPAFSIFLPPDPNVPLPQADLPDQVLPWKRKFVIKNALDLFDPTCTSKNPADCRRYLTEFVDPKIVTPPAAGVMSITHATTTTPLAFTVQPKFDQALLCKAADPAPGAATPRDPYAFTIPNDCKNLTPSPSPGPTAGKPPSTDATLTTDGEVLTPDSNWALCFHLTPAPNSAQGRPYYCQTFSVHSPFFQYRSASLPLGASEPQPYLVKTLGENRHVAVFGVVDPDVINNIGRLNYGWLNHDPKSESVVEAIDPSVALKQLFDKCDADPVCKPARKVLLAQMPAFKASQLLAGMDFTFDLVIAQTDPAHETGPTTISKTTDPDSERDADKKPPFIVTPGALYDSSHPGHLQLRVQTATVTRPSPCCKGEWNLSNKKEDRSYNLPAPVPGPNLRTVAAAAVHAVDHRLDPQPANPHALQQPWPEASWSTEQILQRLALLAMQKIHRSDVALIQQRDLFQPNTIGLEAVTPDNLQELLDRIFWKNDYSVRVPVTGASIKSILAQGKAFDQADQNSLTTDLSKGRGLVSLGAFTEAATQTLIINGSPEQDANLYSLAATDFLAIGDTGYPDLQKPAVPPAYRLKEFPHLYSLGGLVCREIAGRVPAFAAAPCGPLGSPANQTPKPDYLTSNQYLDTLNQRPFDSTKGYTPFRQTLAWLVPSLHYHSQFSFYSGANATEAASHQRPIWYLTLEKADFGLTLNVHRNLTGQLPFHSNDPNLIFNGVSVPQATAPNSNAISFDNRTRLLRTSRNLDWFFMDDLAFAGTKTQKCVNPSATAPAGSLAACNYVKSESTNTLSFEGGLLPYIHPRFRQPADLKLLLSARVDTQLDSPPEVIALPDMMSLNGKLNHSFTLLGKFGVRLEDERSWLETGLELGKRLRTPEAIRFNTGQICPLNAGDKTVPGSFAYCVNTLVPPIPDGATFSAQTTTRPAQGIFLNFSLNIPLPWQKPFSKPVAFLIENKGDLFFNRAHDLNTDTRYFDKWANSLVIPVLGNFSLKPEVDVFFFENKIGGVSYHSVQTMVTFGYQFAWHQGLPWWKTLQYANPSPTTSSPTGGR